MSLTVADHLKYLGVTIASDLRWKLHVDSLYRKAMKKLWFLKRNLRHAPFNVKLSAYTTLVRPTLEYACAVWDPYKKNQIDKLEKIKRLAARFICSRYG